MPCLGQVAIHEPQPLQRISLISTVFFDPPSVLYSSSVIALYGQTSTQKAQPSQFSSMGWETVDSSSRKSLDSMVDALEADANAWAMASSKGLGKWQSPARKMPSVAQSTGLILACASLKKPSALSGTL